VEINVVDPFARRGYRFKGHATILAGGDEFDEALSFYERRGSPVGMIREIIRVRVDSAAPVDSPAYDLGRTEDELRGQWERHFASIRPREGSA
jgi:hypothetical protein